MHDRLSIDTLRYVRAVMEELSFSWAARALKVSQLALSTAVARLEHQLGQRIFDRSTRGVTATDFGEEIRPMVDAALGAVDGIASRARQRQEAERGDGPDGRVAPD
ncbi:LysR family transcriptional regulator [Corynebacterium kalidii]